MKNRGEEGCPRSSFFLSSQGTGVFIIVYKVVFHKHLTCIVYWCIYFCTEEEIKGQLRGFPSVTQLAIKPQCGADTKFVWACPPAFLSHPSNTCGVKFPFRKQRV